MKTLGILSALTAVFFFFLGYVTGWREHKQPTVINNAFRSVITIKGEAILTGTFTDNQIEVGGCVGFRP